VLSQVVVEEERGGDSRTDVVVALKIGDAALSLLGRKVGVD
jgi:hypothetical protein